MADTPDTQRLDQIRELLLQREAQIDALLGFVAERDDLLKEVAGSGVESVAIGRYVVLQVDLNTWADIQRMRPQPDSSPSPVEGGQ